MTTFNPETKQWESAKFPYSFPMDLFLGEEILRNLKQTPDRVVQIIHEENYEMTCEDLRVSSIRVAQNLTKLGIKADDVVGVICKHSSLQSYLLTGCVYIGALISAQDISFNVNDMKHLFGITKPKLVVCDAEVIERVQQALRELNFDIKIFVTSKDEFKGASSIFDLLAPTGTEDNFVPPKFAQTVDKKILAIMCSSGTTGAPKGVMLTHATAIPYARFLSMNQSKVTRSLCFSSIFWITGFFPQVLLAFNKKEIRIWTKKAFSYELFSELLEKYNITDVVLAPAQLTTILLSDYKSIPNIEGLKLIACCGSMVSNRLRTLFSEALPDVDMMIPYGMTECSISMSLGKAYKENLSVGPLVANRVVKVVDENEERLGIGEVGEIRAKSSLGFQVS